MIEVTVTDEEFTALPLGDSAAMQPRPINHDFDENKNLSQAAAISCGSDQGVWLQWIESKDFSHIFRHVSITTDRKLDHKMKFL